MDTDEIIDPLAITPDQARRLGLAAEPVADASGGDAEPATPAEEPAEQSEEPAAAGALTLAIPGDFPTEHLPDDYVEQLGEFSAVLASAGVDTAIGQRMLNLYLDASQDNPFLYDTEGNPRDLVGSFSMQDASDEMQKRWGTEYDSNMRLVRQGVAQLGDQFKHWLAETGRGNDPGVLEAIVKWQRGDIGFTRDTAQAELDKLMQSPDFVRPKSLTDGKKLAARVRTLTRIVGEGGESAGRPTPAPVAPTPSAAATPIPAHPAGDARALASAMLADKNGPLNNSTHPGRAAALAKFQRLLASI